MPDQLDPHYATVIRAIIDGRLIPFLGAGANRCGRLDDGPCEDGGQVPDSGELARHLARDAGYSGTEASDLVRVAQYITIMEGLGPLYEKLHELFDVDYPPNSLHRFLTGLPAVFREKGYPIRHQLIVTTNYDDIMERAFREAGEPFDLLAYMADGEHRGKFVHWLPDGTAEVVERPNEYRGLSLDQRPVILKIHGAVDRVTTEWDSFVITEDHYIDYLTRTDISNLIPVTLAAKLRKSHFLFLGYSLRDWNLRVILHRIWGEQKLRYKSWAIQLNPQPVDQQFWRKRDVEILDTRLDGYVAGLSEQLHRLPPAARAS